MQDRHVTVRELAKEVEISTSSIHSILTDELSMRWVSAKRGSCIIITHQLIPRKWFQLSWPNTTFLWFDRLPTLPICLLAIFGYFPIWKRSWKGLDLSHETTLYGTRRQSCTPFAKRHSRNASNNGGTAGRSVLSHKETTSKGWRLQTSIPDQRSDAFWTALVLVFMSEKFSCLRENLDSSTLNRFIGLHFLQTELSFALAWLHE
jgi:hypothetical protein